MSANDTFDRMLDDWFAADAAAPAPAGLLDRVATTTVERAPRAGWMARLRGHWVGSTDPAGARLGAAGTRRLTAVLLVAILGALLMGAAMIVGGQGDEAPALVPADRGTFRMLGPMVVEHRGNSATLLRDGRVLVVGDMGEGRQAESWDPATEAFSPAGQLGAGREDPSGILLPDGRVLIVGGFTEEGRAVQAETWDPVTNSFTPAGTLAHQRGHPILTLQSDGGVLVSGGVKVSGEYVIPDDTAEAWDPASNTFRSADPVPGVPIGARLHDGRILVISDDSAELFEPATGVTQPTGPLTTPRGEPGRFNGGGQSATTLPDGRVLVVGGATCGPIEGEKTGSLSTALHSCSVDAIKSAEIFDPWSNTFSATGSPTEARAQHTATLLLDGRVLVVGGYGYGATSAELFELR